MSIFNIKQVNIVHSRRMFLLLTLGLFLMFPFNTPNAFIITKPAMTALVVAMAGIMLPAIAIEQYKLLSNRILFICSTYTLRQTNSL
jgi:hypothetical protein